MSITSHKLRRTPQQQVGGDLEVNHVTSGANLDSISSYTFSNVDIGSADSTRQVFVLINMQNPRSVSSATIGGVSATQLSGAQGVTASRAGFFAEVPTGTTANVVINTSSSGSYLLYTVYSVINRSSTATEFDFDSAANFFNTPLDRTSTVPANGFFLGVYGSLEDKTFSSSPATFDDYNTDGSAGGVWQVSVSYIDTTGSQSDVSQSLSWTPTDSSGIGYALWSFAS